MYHGKRKRIQTSGNRPDNLARPGKFNKETGELIKESKPNTPPKFQDVFGNTILELAHTNSKIVGITPAMPSGCSLNIMMKEMPDRCFDVGIAEQHAVTFSAGLAAQGTSRSVTSTLHSCSEPMIK